MTSERDSSTDATSTSVVIDMEAILQAEDEAYPFEDDQEDEDAVANVFVDIPLGHDDEEKGNVKHQSQLPSPLRLPLSPSSITAVVNDILAVYRRSHQRHGAITDRFFFSSTDESTTDDDEVDDDEDDGESTAPSLASNDATNTAHSLHDLSRQIRRYRQGLDAKTPHEVALRVENFHKARFLRKHHHKSFRPWGVLALFFHLVDVRQDLEWANDAAYRRAHNLPYMSWTDFEHTHQYKRQYVMKRTPWFVYSIVAASTATLIYSLARMNWTLEHLKVNPMLGPSPEILLDMGALFTPRILGNNEWYRLFAPMVLHAGFIHYVLNMAVLLIFGTAVERIHGTCMTGLVFCMSAVGGNVAGAIFAPLTMSVGASGGIFSLLGLCLADIWSNWDVLTMKDDHGERGVPVLGVLFFICFDICLNLSIGLTPWVDNFAHVGGFVYGTCLGLVFAERLGQSGFFGAVPWKRRTGTACCKWLAFMVVAALMVSTFGVLYSSDPERGPPNVCPGCRHISCVPFPFWKDDKWWECDSCMAVGGNLQQGDNGTMVLELQCPEGGEAVYIDMGTQDPHKDAIRVKLPGYCRRFC